MSRQHAIAAAFALCSSLGPAVRPNLALAQDDTLPAYARDRGPGVPASIFGTYLRHRELVVYPFFEYTVDNNREYQPAEFGLGPDVDFRAGFAAPPASSFSATG